FGVSWPQASTPGCGQAWPALQVGRQSPTLRHSEVPGQGVVWSQLAVQSERPPPSGWQNSPPSASHALSLVPPSGRLQLAPMSPLLGTNAGTEQKPPPVVPEEPVVDVPVLVVAPLVPVVAVEVEVDADVVPVVPVDVDVEVLRPV